MSKISFEGIGELVATFACEETVQAGQVVKVTGPCTVGPCSDGDRFCGVALSAGDGYAAVQLAGFITVAAGEDVTEGWCALVADGAGGVKADASEADGTGSTYLVVEAADGSAVVLL